MDLQFFELDGRCAGLAFWDWTLLLDLEHGITIGNWHGVYEIGGIESDATWMGWIGFLISIMIRDFACF